MKSQLQTNNSKLFSEPLISINNTLQTNDVSFSIPDWRNQEIKDINEQYEKEVYKAVPVSLTDFDTKEEVEFLSEPQKCEDERYVYQRKLLNRDDFSILAFILCLEQIFLTETQKKENRIEKFKKKINDLDYCTLTNVPNKMKGYYDNKIIKKILFQYINKGSYNVSLLEIVLRRNEVLKFSLSLVSKAILKKRGLVSSYTEVIAPYVEMRNCGDEFDVMSNIQVREKLIESENFKVEIIDEEISIFRKQNVVSIPTKKPNKYEKKLSDAETRLLFKTHKNIDEKKTSKLEQRKSLTPPPFIFQSQKQIYRKSTKESQLEQEEKMTTKSAKKEIKKSNSLVKIFRRIICF